MIEWALIGILQAVLTLFLSTAAFGDDSSEPGGRVAGESSLAMAAYTTAVKPYPFYCS